MKIQRLKPSRIKNRINVVFDDGGYLPLFIDDVVKNSLKVGEECDFDKLKDMSINYLARQYALRQIAISPKVEAILRRKLRQKFRDYNPDDLIDSLKPYLDEKKFIEYFVAKNKKKSNREIEFRLKMLKINYHPEQLDQEKIEKILQKKKNISISALMTRGFAYDDIKSVFAKLGKLK